MLPYYPALRFKLGEYTACSRLPAEILENIVPRFIIPPPKERDPELGRAPTPDEIAYWSGRRIGRCWPFRPAFLDAQYVASILGDSGLARLFEVAGSYNPNLVPIATVSDLKNPLFRELINATVPRLGIFDHYEGFDAEQLVVDVSKLGCLPQDCVVFVDFSGADLNPELAAVTCQH